MKGLLHGTDPAAERGVPSPALLPAGACGAGAGQGTRAEGQGTKKSKDHIYLAKGAQSAPDLGRKKGGDGERRGIAESRGRGETGGERSKTKQPCVCKSHGQGRQGGRGPTGARGGAAKSGSYTDAPRAQQHCRRLGQGQSQPCRGACRVVGSLLWRPGDTHGDKRYSVAVPDRAEEAGSHTAEPGAQLTRSRDSKGAAEQT